MYFIFQAYEDPQKSKPEQKIMFKLYKNLYNTQLKLNYFLKIYCIFSLHKIPEFIFRLLGFSYLYHKTKHYIITVNISH